MPIVTFTVAFAFKFLSIHYIINEKQTISVKAFLAGRFLRQLLNQTPSLYLADLLEVLQKEHTNPKLFPLLSPIIQTLTKSNFRFMQTFCTMLFL